MGYVSTMNFDKLTLAPVANVTNLLTGRLPGLNSKQESGTPGQDAALLGIRSFGSTLFIVDGIKSSLNQAQAKAAEWIPQIVTSIQHKNIK